MRTSASIWVRCLLVAAGLHVYGCGSDFGGVPDEGVSRPSTDGGGRSMPDSASSSDGASSADVATADGAAPPPSDAMPDGSTADQSIPRDTSSPPDVIAQPDGQAPTDGSVSSDTPRDGAGNGTDGSTTGDAPTGVKDSNVDSRNDAAVDVNSDARDGSDDRGPTGPACGNGVKDPGEECDDGNTLDFDACSSLCTDRRACTCCERVNDEDTLFCQQMEGTADTGPKAGTKKSELCQQTYACLLRSRCAYDAVEPLMACYCGTGNVGPTGNSCNDATKSGPCMNELLASMEVDEDTAADRAARVSERINVNTYAGGVATWWAGIIDLQACPDDCVNSPPVWSACPNPDLHDGGTDAPEASVDSATDLSQDTATISIP